MPFRQTREAVLFDIDGVLLDSTHRNRHLYPHEDWASYYDYEEMKRDVPIRAGIQLLQMLSRTHHIFLVTARPDAVWFPTISALGNAGLSMGEDWRGILMRGRNSTWSSCKSEAVERIVSMGYKISLAVDDSEHNCALLEQCGIPTLRVHSEIHAGPHVDDTEFVRGMYV